MDEPYEIRTCHHLEYMWSRWDYLNKTMSLDDVSSAWVLDSHHVAGEFVCADCLQHEIGRIVFNAYADSDLFVIGTDE